MRRIATLALLAVLAGCIANKPVMPAGTYVTNLGQISKKWMASLTLDHFERIYAPAQTRLDFTHPVSSGFGAFLVYELRQRGYAVNTYVENKEGDTPSNGLPFSYVIDEVVTDEDPNAPRYFYLRLNIGNEILSRMFIERQGDLHPASLWSFALDDSFDRDIAALPVFREVINEDIDELMYFVNRIVTPEKGIVLRDLEGRKLHPIGRDKVISKSRILTEEEVPAYIATHSVLKGFTWAQGEWNNNLVLFAWELTDPEPDVGTLETSVEPEELAIQAESI